MAAPRTSNAGHHHRHSVHNDPPIETFHHPVPSTRPGMVKKGPILAFGLTTVLVFLLTTIALFTPGWRYFRHGGPQLGLVTYHCGSGYREVNFRDCKDWYSSRWHFERFTLAFMILAFLLELGAIAVFVILFVKPRKQLGGAAAAIAFLIFACLFSALLVYGVNFQSKPVYMRANTNEMNGNSVLGYAYWVGVTALVVSVVPLAASGAVSSALAALHS